MMSPTLSRSGIVAFACAAALAGCGEKPTVKTVTPVASAAFDGTWSGTFFAGPDKGADGLPCSDAPAGFEAKSGAFVGQIRTRFGPVTGSGALGPNAVAQGSLGVDGEAVTGSFSARIIRANEMTGTYHGLFGCAGTILLRRL